MLELLAWMVVVLLVGPPVLIVAAGLLVLVAGIGGGSSRRVRERFRCPITGRVVTADFLVPAGARHPSALVSCTGLPDHRRITCRQACRPLVEVRWTASRVLFPRWALTAGGMISSRRAGEPVAAN